METIKYIFYILTGLLSLLLSLLIYTYNNDKKTIYQKIKELKESFSNNCDETKELLTKVTTTLDNFSESIQNIDTDQLLTSKDVEHLVEKIKDLKTETEALKHQILDITLDVKLLNNKIRFNQ